MNQYSACNLYTYIINVCVCNHLFFCWTLNLPKFHGLNYNQIEKFDETREKKIKIKKENRFFFLLSFCFDLKEVNIANDQR